MAVMPFLLIMIIAVITIVIIITITNTCIIIIIIKGAPLIWSEEAVTPLVVKSMN